MGPRRSNAERISIPNLCEGNGDLGRRDFELDCFHRAGEYQHVHLHDERSELARLGEDGFRLDSVMRREHKKLERDVEPRERKRSESGGAPREARIRSESEGAIGAHGAGTSGESRSKSGDDPRQGARSKRRRWTQEEDSLLLELVRIYGPKNWSLIAEERFRGSRSADQLRTRYTNILQPDRVRSRWTAEEDRVLISLQKDLGNQWFEIAQALDGRVANDVKNRFRALARSSLNKERAGRASAPALTAPRDASEDENI